MGLLLQSGSSIQQGYGVRHFNLHDGLNDNPSRKMHSTSQKDPVGFTWSVVFVHTGDTGGKREISAVLVLQNPSQATNGI